MTSSPISPGSSSIPVFLQEPSRSSETAQIITEEPSKIRNVIAFSTKNLFNSKPIYTKHHLKNNSISNENDHSLYSVYGNRFETNKNNNSQPSYYDLHDKYLQEQQYIENKRNFYATHQETEQHHLFSSSSSYSYNGMGGDEDYERIIEQVAQLYNNKLNRLNSNNNNENNDDLYLNYY